MIFCTAEPNLISVSKSILTRPLLTPSSKSTERLLDFASIFSCWVRLCYWNARFFWYQRLVHAVFLFHRNLNMEGSRVSRRRRIFMVNFESLPPLPWIKLFFSFHHPLQLKVQESSYIYYTFTKSPLLATEICPEFFSSDLFTLRFSWNQKLHL